MIESSLSADTSRAPLELARRHRVFVLILIRSFYMLKYSTFSHHHLSKIGLVFINYILGLLYRAIHFVDLLNTSLFHFRIEARFIHLSTIHIIRLSITAMLTSRWKRYIISIANTIERFIYYSLLPRHEHVFVTLRWSMLTGFNKFHIWIPEHDCLLLFFIKYIVLLMLT